MSLTDGNDVVETLSPKRADQPFADRVRRRRPDRRRPDSDAELSHRVVSAGVKTFRGRGLGSGMGDH